MKKNTLKSFIISVGFILFTLFSLSLDRINFFRPNSLTAQTPESNWVTISYAGLLKDDIIVRTGQALKSAVTDPKLRGIVQPFVDPYSFLLDYALEMMRGPNSLPQHSVVDHFPVGSKQPAWIALFRGGRINISSDNKKNAKVFLLSSDPKTAYDENYSVIRHCLRGLAPEDGSELSVEVYAYRNNYQKSELELNLTPYSFRSSNFPQPSDKLALDLIGLKNFFLEGGQLEGAFMDKKEGLILYAKRSGIQTIARHPVSFADLAVAYRAVFHAGDNPAFVSLDPHQDPTKAMVSFGGFLEDTRIGYDILEADKRFKTISTGIDPNTYEDIRVNTRSYVPTFFTVSERELLPQAGEVNKNWVATRFWFYPDSIEIDTDLNYEYAKIINPQFMADAERSRADFATQEEFEKFKKSSLSPSVQRNIDHLNQNYLQYASVYPEIRELTTIGRIMGICSWLQRANPTWLDLDSLLSIELPEIVTEMERTRMLAVTLVSYLSTEEIEDDYVRKNSQVIYLTPILDKTCKEYFPDWSNLAQYLCFKSNIDNKFFQQFEPDAKNMLLDYGEKKVRELIKTQNDLNALADYATNEVGVSQPKLVEAFRADIERDKAELDKLKVQIEGYKEKMKTATGEEIASLSSGYNEAVKKFNSLVSSLTRDHEILNQLRVRRPVVVRITGGVELGSKYFNIKQTKSSENLQQLKEISKETEVEWSDVKDTGQWIRSRTGQGLAFMNYIPKSQWVSQEATQASGANYEHFKASDKQNYWVMKETRTGSWRDLLETENSQLRERWYDAQTRSLRITVYNSGDLERAVVGKVVDRNKIVFTPLTEEDLVLPQKPPKWWFR